MAKEMIKEYIRLRFIRFNNHSTGLNIDQVNLIKQELRLLRNTINSTDGIRNYLLQYHFNETEMFNQLTELQLIDEYLELRAATYTTDRNVSKKLSLALYDELDALRDLIETPVAKVLDIKLKKAITTDANKTSTEDSYCIRDYSYKRFNN